MGIAIFLSEILTFGDKMKSILTHTKDLVKTMFKKLLDFKDLI
jgi:hypothetical protein